MSRIHEWASVRRVRLGWCWRRAKWMLCRAAQLLKFTFQTCHSLLQSTEHVPDPDYVRLNGLPKKLLKNGLKRLLAVAPGHTHKENTILWKKTNKLQHTIKDVNETHENQNLRKISWSWELYFSPIENWRIRVLNKSWELKYLHREIKFFKINTPTYNDIERNTIILLLLLLW